MREITCREGESLIISDPVTIRITRIERDSVRLTIAAPQRGGAAEVDGRKRAGAAWRTKGTTARPPDDMIH